MAKVVGRKYQVISGDGHVETPPESWVKYVPDQYKARAPRLIKLPEGGEGWVVEGMPLLHNGQNITGGKNVKFKNDTYFNTDGSAAPGAGGWKQRLHEQDIDGVDAEVLFPPVFATRFIQGIADKKAYLSMVQAYNTFLAQDFCGNAPDRLIGNGVVPVSGVDEAIAELKRCKELGLNSVAFFQFPNGSGAPKKEDDKFWETALKLNMRLSPHGTYGDASRPLGGAGTSDQEIAGAIAQGGGSVAGPVYPMVQTITAGVFDRFPEMKIYIAETHAGWIPYTFWKIDDNYQIFKHAFGVSLKKTPSQYIRDHYLFSFIRDPLAIQSRDGIPWEMLMWGNDFPHSVGSYPESRKYIEMTFKGVPENVKRKVLLENPAAFYGLDLEKAITKTPA